MKVHERDVVLPHVLSHIACFHICVNHHIPTCASHMGNRSVHLDPFNIRLISVDIRWPRTIACKPLKLNLCASFFFKLRLHSLNLRCDADFILNGNQVSLTFLTLRCQSVGYHTLWAAYVALHVVLPCVDQLVEHGDACVHIWCLTCSGTYCLDQNYTCWIAYERQRVR